MWNHRSSSKSRRVGFVPWEVSRDAEGFYSLTSRRKPHNGYYRGCVVRSSALAPDTTSPRQGPSLHVDCSRLPTIRQWDGRHRRRSFSVALSSRPKQIVIGCPTAPERRREPAKSRRHFASRYISRLCRPIRHRHLVELPLLKPRWKEILRNNSGQLSSWCLGGEEVSCGNFYVLYCRLSIATALLSSGSTRCGRNSGI